MIVAALVAGFLGPKAVRVPGLAIGLIGLAMVVAENAGMARRGGLSTERRMPKMRRETGEPEAVEASEDAWRRERERRASEGR